MNQWIIGGLLFQCHYFHFYLQWESVFWFVLWFQCLPGLFWKRMELLLRGLKELSDLTGCISIKFVKGRTAFSRRDMWTFFGDGGVHIQTSGNIKGCWSDQFYINKIMQYADTSCVKVLTVFIQSYYGIIDFYTIFESNCI